MAARRSLLKVVILGDAGVGKTCLLHQYVNKKFLVSYKASIGCDLFTKEMTIDKTLVAFQLWDTAGQEKQNSIAKNFYRNSECCILVFDLTDVKSFEEIDEWRKEYLNQLQPKDPETFPFVLLGNKYDKTNEIKVTQTKIDMYCQAHNNMPYFNTSAKEDINVDKAFEDVARLAFQRNLKNDIVFQPTKVKLVRQSTVQTKVCCV